MSDEPCSMARLDAGLSRRLMKRKIFSQAQRPSVLLVAVAVWLVACAVTSDSEAEREPLDEAALAAKAAQVLQGQRAQSKDERIPKVLIGSARCIGVFPSVVKAGLLIGARRGHGLVSCRKKDGGNWSDAAPAFYTLKSGSIGLQAGVRSSQLILLFLTDEGVDSLLGNDFTLTGDLKIASAPLGYDANIGDTPAAVIGYSRSVGTFAGIKLERATLVFDDDSNEAVYGQTVIDPLEVLFARFEVPASVEVFNQALAKFAPQSERGKPDDTSDK